MWSHSENTVSKQAHVRVSCHYGIHIFVLGLKLCKSAVKWREELKPWESRPLTASVGCKKSPFEISANFTIVRSSDSREVKVSSCGIYRCDAAPYTVWMLSWR
ncbi:hypothetical protein IRJ41_004527 [Triplophysa rosa]|uniref:Uncharacterized protein n=1 Tax=Triplophysa rosa TaxID=992332 RepID=A0A9W7WJU6_TRIRA|nr:hypothetical protein IRJ41_004527 [Triplophysa rosa]